MATRKKGIKGALQWNYISSQYRTLILNEEAEEFYRGVLSEERLERMRGGGGRILALNPLL